MSDSKNDIAWSKLFEKYAIVNNINDNGIFNISSTQINEFREARLMTKFDHKSQLPILFQENKLSILPTSRGGYVLGQFETFSDFNSDDIEVTPIHFPMFLESLDYKDITSESTAINCAFVSKILHDFTGEENLLPTVSGRMSSSAFAFNITSSGNLFRVNVENSQIEIDGGYEGDNSLNIIEAKNYISNDFLIRQLYYPYKLWANKIAKKVRPMFLTYTNGIFHLREYEFVDFDHYNSLVLVNHKKYAIQEGYFNLESLEDILNRIQVVQEPYIPFPQANSFDRVINICELLHQKGFIAIEELTQNYDFDVRQTDYYLNAAKYLGLVEKKRDLETGLIGGFLTEKGQRVFQLGLIERQKEFIKLILEHRAFQLTLESHLKKGEMPTIDEIVEFMKESNLYNVASNSTYYRRASTIIGWINWIVAQIEE